MKSILIASLLLVTLFVTFIVAQNPNSANSGGALIRSTVTATCSFGGQSGDFVGSFLPTGFRAESGRAVADGILSGSCVNEGIVIKTIVNRIVRGVPVKLPSAARSENAANTRQGTPGACRILALDLGPLDLNLLGLRIDLSEINLLIEAIPGSGNLLGNLLCGIVNLLNGLGGILTLVNRLNQLLGFIIGNL